VACRRRRGGLGISTRAKTRYPKASILTGNRVVFDIKGNSYRLIVAIFYPARIVYVKFFGTHAEYDKVDALQVDDF